MLNWHESAKNLSNPKNNLFLYIQSEKLPRDVLVFCINLIILQPKKAGSFQDRQIVLNALSKKAVVIRFAFVLSE